MSRILSVSGILLFVVPLLIANNARAQVAASTPGPGGRFVRIPLTIDYLALAAALKQQIYTDHERAPLWNGSDQCQYFYAQNPRFARAGDNVQLETDGSLMIGVMMGSSCVSPIVWNGIIQAQTAPYMAPRLQLKFRVTDINLLDQNHQKTLIAGRGFDLVKQFFIPRLETFSFDLNPAFENFQELVKAGAPPEVVDRVTQTLATLRAEPELRADDTGVRATIDLTLPPMPTLPTAAAPPPLSAQELATFETRLDQWDAFLVFAIKQMGDTSKDPQLRDDLLALLLDSRHRLVDALANPQSGGPDPIRLLFIDEWQRLGEIIREAVQRGTLGSDSLQFLSFMSAGDALFALDQAAPALGVQITAEDLRRLAHMIGPSAPNPLSFDFEEDPQLRKMFHLEEPLASEGPLDTQPSTIAATPIPSASATPIAAPSPSVTILPTPNNPPSATAPPTPSPLSMLRLPLLLLSPDNASAEDMPAGKIELVAKLQELARKLRRTVVNSANAGQYRADYEELLRYGAQREIAEENIDYRFRPLYLRQVKSTAWQESCWRQFILDGNRVVYLESSTHDLGLMQVNKYVWRGFYNIDRLQWDVLYNASAGMQILGRLLDDVELKRGAYTSANPEELARSVYAAYNGGPGSYRRWRGREARQLRSIDNSFWAKYQAVLMGHQIDILSCAEDWGAQH